MMLPTERRQTNSQNNKITIAFSTPTLLVQAITDICRQYVWSGTMQCLPNHQQILRIRKIPIDMVCPYNKWHVNPQAMGRASTNIGNASTISPPLISEMDFICMMFAKHVGFFWIIEDNELHLSIKNYVMICNAPYQQHGMTKTLEHSTFLQSVVPFTYMD